MSKQARLNEIKIALATSALDRAARVAEQARLISQLCAMDDARLARTLGEVSQ